jgi:hypothetical protein
MSAPTQKSLWPEAKITPLRPLRPKAASRPAESAAPKAGLILFTLPGRAKVTTATPSSGSKVTVTPGALTGTFSVAMVTPAR